MRCRLVSNLARPGGNVTGLGGLGLGMGAKQIELLHQAVPHARRVGALVHPEYPGRHVFLPELKAAAQSLGLELRQVVLRSPDELDSAFAALARERVDALYLGGQPFMLPAPARSRPWSPTSGCRPSASSRS